MPEPSTFKPVTETVKQAVKDIGGQIKGLGDDVTGKIRATFDEEMEEIVSWGETVFGRVKQVFGPFLSSIGQWFMQTKLMKSTAGFLKKILGIEQRREKKERAGLGIKVKGWFDKLLPILASGIGFLVSGLGAMLGGILAPFIAPLTEPFRMLSNVFGKLTKTKGWLRFSKFMKDPFGLGAFKADKGGPLKRIFTWFRNLSRFVPKGLITAAQKGLKMFKTLFGWIGKAGKFVAGAFGSGFLKGFMASVKKIFWPIQIIMSVIDFIKGFQDTEGDIFDKVVGGVKNVLKEFFGFPVKILGMLIDWVAEQFGIENLGAKDAMMDAFNWFIDFPLDLITTAKDFFVDMLPKAWAALGNVNLDIFTPILDYFGKIKDGILAGIWSYIDSHPWMKKLISGVGGGGILKSLEDTAKDVENRQKEEMTEYEKQRLEQEKEKLELAKRQTSGQQISVVNQSSDGMPSRPPPTETTGSRFVLAGATADDDSY